MPTRTTRGGELHGSPGNDTDSDGALLAAPQPYKGEKTRVSPVCLRVPLECGLKPKSTDSLNPVDGFHVLQGVEEVKSSSSPGSYCAATWSQASVQETAGRSTLVGVRVCLFDIRTRKVTGT
jgi:hypothetical protein